MRKKSTNKTKSMDKSEGKTEPHARCFGLTPRRFTYALQTTSCRTESRKPLNNHTVDVLSRNEEKEIRGALTNSSMHSKSGDFSHIDDAETDLNLTDPVRKNKKCIHKESQDKQIQRKYQMRDEFGHLVHHVRVNSHKTKKTITPKQPKRGVAERLNGITLKVRSFKVGTLSKTFRKSDTLTTQCKFTVDCIEIANEVRIEASEVTSCEWCTVQRLPSLFLQTTPVACLRLRIQLDMYEDYSQMWYACQSNNQDEKYIVLIFENKLTVPEQITLEEIFTEIGRSNNIGNFPVKLSFEEANNRLKIHNCARKQEIQSTLLQSEEDELPVISQAMVAVSSPPDPPPCEIATLSVSDSDEDNLIELPPLPKQDIKKLVVYPPPPAKGGITITEDDLNCLEEGEFLNDVILDFYLRYLVCEQLKKENATKCHIFSSFFFKHLTQEDHRRLSETTGLSVQECRHNRVKTWTRNVNIFEKDFIFVPINQMAHWYLAVICFPGQVSQTSGLDLCVNRHRKHSVEYLCNQSPPNPMSLFYCQESSEQLSRWSRSIDELGKSFWFLSDDEAEDGIQAVKNRSVLNSERNDLKRPCILIMDSLNNRARSSVVQILQEYLQEEWRVKMGYRRSFGKGVISGWNPHVPKQDNYTDCGIYLLQYVESFLKDPPQTYHPSMDLKDWFSQKTVKKKREQIKRLILGLHREQTV